MERVERATESSALEVAEDFALQQRQWAVERALWAAMGLLALAALLGGLGRGWLSAARAEAGNVAVEFDRLPHVDTETELVVRWRGVAAPGGRGGQAGRAGGAAGDAPGSIGEVVVAVSSRYLESVRIERVSPAPLRTVAAEGETRHHFAAAGGGDARFVVVPTRPGRVEGALRIGGAAAGEVNLVQFVLP